MAELTLTCPKCGNSSNVLVEADVDEFVCQHCGAKSPVIGDYEALSKTVRDPLIGQSIADWEIVQKVGEGGFGAVYKAIDKNLQRPVAIKVMLQSLAGNLEFVQKFYREAITAAALNHPNIVGIHRVGRDEQRNLNFLVMEFLEGKTLADILEDRGPFNMDEAIPVILQCADALAAAHDKNIVHRDIKPENIMMDSRGVVKITDFGLAKTLSSDQKSTKVMGTPHFMSPEQFEGKAVDGRTDIYSLGVTFYFLLTKAKPYKGENTVQIIYSILTQEPQPVTELAPEVPEEIWRIIRKMIAKDLADRYASFRDVRRDLLAFQQGVETKKMNCPACRAVNIRGRRFCMKCGASLVVRCPHCGREEPTGTKLCSECGSNIESLVKIRENLDRGGKLRAFGDLKKALGCYKEILKLDPEHEGAVSATRAIEASLQHLTQHRAAIDTLVEKGRPDEALLALDNLVKEFPDNEEVANYAKTIRRTIVHRAVDVSVQAAEKARTEGRFEDALRSYKRALETDPDRSDVAERLFDLQSKIYALEETLKQAEAALHAGKPAEAMRLARDVLAMRPGDEHAKEIAEQAKQGVELVAGFVSEAKDLLAARRHEEAIDRLRMAREISPDEESVRSLLAEAEAARDAFAGRILRVRELISSGHLEEAQVEADALLGERADLPEVVSLKKDAQQRLSEKVYAEKTRALLDSARKSESDGDLERALGECGAVLEREPENESALQTKARVEGKIGETQHLREEVEAHLAADEFGKGIEVLQRIKVLRPADRKLAEEIRAVTAKQALVGRAIGAARTFVQAGRFDKAIEEVEKALAVAPKHGEAGRLKRDATKSLNAIRKHVSEARHRIESELFEEALRELAKASEAGAPEEDLSELRSAAEEGRKVLLHAEASHALGLGEYEEAERLYGEVLTLDGNDRDAKKGQRLARKAIVRSEREAVLPKVLVSAVLVLCLVFVQIHVMKKETSVTRGRGDELLAEIAKSEQAGGAGGTDIGGTHVPPPIEPNQPPIDPNRPPVEPNQPPVEPNRPPVEPNLPPVEPNLPPIEPRSTPLPVDPKAEQVTAEKAVWDGAWGAVLEKQGFDRLGALLAAREKVGSFPEVSGTRSEMVGAALRRVVEELRDQAESELLRGDPAKAAEIFGQLGQRAGEFESEFMFGAAQRFAEALAAAVLPEDPEQRLTSLRETRTLAGGTANPDVRLAREQRVDDEIRKAVEAWVRRTTETTGESWQRTAAAYKRIVDDVSVKATVLPDGRRLVDEVSVYREFAEAMAQAEGFEQGQNYPKALDAYDYASRQAREDKYRTAAQDGCDRTRAGWIELMRKKVREAQALDSKEFYEQAIRQLAEMASVLRMSPEEAFKQVTGR